MDPSSSYRLAVRVGAYVKFTDDGARQYSKACNIPKILDRDSTNWNDLVTQIATEINLGSKHKLRVTYWDKVTRSYEEITSDQKLLHAIDMYWEIRRLSVQVLVMKNDESDIMFDIGRQQNMPCVLQGSTSVEPPLQIASSHIEPPLQIESSHAEPPTEIPWVDDEVEYVGLNDEGPYKALLSDSSDSESDGEVEGDDSEVEGDDGDVLKDDLVVDDERDCESIVHATDLENPTIEVGITFGDDDTFKKAIRQYAIKGEYEIAAPYSEATRYRGFCRAERCKWRIHASQIAGWKDLEGNKCNSN